MIRSLSLAALLVGFGAAAMPSASADTASIPTLAIGAEAPDFDLPGVDGKRYTLASFKDAKVLVLVFTANHCPTAQAYEERIAKLHADFAPQGAAVVLVSPNDPLALRLDEQGYTDLGDTIEEMKVRAKERGWAFPYLYDGETQTTARKYGPVATPHVFVFDAARKLRFTGRVDDNENPAKARTAEARDAIEAVLAGRPVPVETTKVFGCSVKWADKSASVKAGLEKWAQEPVTFDAVDAAGLKAIAAGDAKKLRLVNVWATWCGPCLIEFPDLVSLHRIYRGRDFEVVTVNADTPEAQGKAKAFLEAQHASMRNVGYDKSDPYSLIELIDPAWPGALPHTALVAPGGRVLYRSEGTFDMRDLRRHIVGWLGRYYHSLPGGAASASAPAPARPADQVKVDGRILEGTVGTDPSVRVFKGVPFAAPPVGPLRWRAPQPAPVWTGARKADQWGTRCMQGPMFGPLLTRDTQMGEDCLYLNVWTTAKSPSEKRPVLVVFHGGGFAAGSASEPRTDGEWFAKQGIVVVEPNYRLAVFGFLAHPELTLESGGHGSGNYGMLDQAAALDWVQRNIAAFGGDPGNVTINGESAGSMSVSALMASPLTRHLVHKAIGESGAFFVSPSGSMAEKTLAEKEQDGVKFATSVGASSLAELRAKPSDELLAAMMKVDHGWGYSPGVDGYFLPEKVSAIYAAGKQARIPVLAGWNSSELGMSVAMNPQKPTAATFAEQLRQRFDDQAEAALKVYPAPDDEQAMQSAADLASDLFISYSTWKWIETHVGTGHAPVYRYRFDRVLPDPSGRKSFGAVHAVDIEYAFNTLDSKKADWQAEDRETARTMATYFANFVKTGNPSGPGLPEWPEFGKTRRVMHLDAVSGAAPEKDRARYEFLDSVAAAHP